MKTQAVIFYFQPYNNMATVTAWKKGTESRTGLVLGDIAASAANRATVGAFPQINALFLRGIATKAGGNPKAPTRFRAITLDVSNLPGVSPNELDGPCFYLDPESGALVAKLCVQRKVLGGPDGDVTETVPVRHFFHPWSVTYFSVFNQQMTTLQPGSLIGVLNLRVTPPADSTVVRKRDPATNCWHATPPPMMFDSARSVTTIQAGVNPEQLREIFEPHYIPFDWNVVKEMGPAAIDEKSRKEAKRKAEENRSATSSSSSSSTAAPQAMPPLLPVSPHLGEEEEDALIAAADGVVGSEIPVAKTLYDFVESVRLVRVDFNDNQAMQGAAKRSDHPQGYAVIRAGTGTCDENPIFSYETKVNGKPVLGPRGPKHEAKRDDIVVIRQWTKSDQAPTDAESIARLPIISLHISLWSSDCRGTGLVDVDLWVAMMKMGWKGLSYDALLTVDAAETALLTSNQMLAQGSQCVSEGDPTWCFVCRPQFVVWHLERWVALFGIPVSIGYVESRRRFQSNNKALYAPGPNEAGDRAVLNVLNSVPDGNVRQLDDWTRSLEEFGDKDKWNLFVVLAMPNLDEDDFETLRAMSTTDCERTLRGQNQSSDLHRDFRSPEQNYSVCYAVRVVAEPAPKATLVVDEQTQDGSTASTAATGSLGKRTLTTDGDDLATPATAPLAAEKTSTKKARAAGGGKKSTTA